MASQLFIAYTEGDRQTAGIVRTGLAKGGIRSWAALRDVPVGADRKAAIQEALDSSGACLVILSPYSDNEALTELAKRAKQRELPMFVLSLANIFPPYVLAEALWNATTVVADLTPTDAQVAYLVQTLHSALPESFRDASLIVAEEVVSPITTFPKTPQQEEAVPPRNAVLPPITPPGTPPAAPAALPESASAPPTTLQAVAPALILDIPPLPVSSLPVPSTPLETSTSPPMFTGEYGVLPAASPPVSPPPVSALPDAPPTLTLLSEARPAPAINRALFPILTCALVLLLGLFTALVVHHSLTSADWKEFAPAGGEFTARMPGNPTPLTRSGDGIAMIVYRSNDGKSQYIVSYFDLSSTEEVNDPKMVIDLLKKRRVAALQGTLAEERPVTAGSQSGEEFIVQNPQGIAMKDMRFRVFMVNNRVFQLEAMGDEMALHSSETDRFFDSFHAPGL